VHNLRVNPDVEIRDETVVRPMRAREVKDEDERSRLWKLAIAAYPPYAEYQERTARRIPVFVAEFNLRHDRGTPRTTVTLR
jgi:deazaflavin-dependent oxidoreductase (nitroreductase family)